MKKALALSDFATDQHPPCQHFQRYLDCGGLKPRLQFGLLLPLVLAWPVFGQVNFEVLRSFSVSDQNGVNPTAELLQGNDGLLYGTTQYGGSGKNGGTVFKISPDGSGYTVLHSFGKSGPDGKYPVAALVQAAGGGLYGTTRLGGSGDMGTVYRINPDGSGYRVLLSFATGGDGYNPWSSLKPGRDGLLYGTTQFGGNNGVGTIYRVSPEGSAYTLVYHFSNAAGSGEFPVSGLAQAEDGALYGVTPNGGLGNVSGTVFRVAEDGSGYKTLYTCGSNSGDGLGPRTGLVIGQDGALYGTAENGGNGNGTVYRLNRDGSGYKTLHTFGNIANDGLKPQASLLVGSDGTLYGTTSAGGQKQWGILFSLRPDGSDYTILHSFQLSDGANPAAALVLGQDGKFYGTAFAGGSSSGGVIFRMSINRTLKIKNIPADLVVEAASGAGSTVSWTAPVATDASGNPVPVICLPPSGSLFSLGSHAVTCTAKDGSGNTATAQFVVTVRDTTPPLFGEVPAALAAEAASAAGAVVNWPSLLATDLVDGTVRVVCSPASGSTFSLGTTTVACKAVDASGNSFTASFTVVVRDTTAPLFSEMPSNLAVEASSTAGAAVSWPELQASDAVDGLVKVACSPPSGSVFALGTNIVTCLASDSRGNTATNTFMVTVLNPAPQLAILDQPTSLSIAAGEAASFQVTASGEKLSYQWSHNGSSLSGATNAVLILPNVTRKDSGAYAVQISSGASSISSDEAILRVMVPLHFSPPARLASGALQFASTCLDGGSISPDEMGSLEAQASSDLFTWNLLPGALQLLDGKLVLTETAPRTQARLFYRIAWRSTAAAGPQAEP